MAMTIPTREGQGLGEFLSELNEAARRLMYLASDPANCWVSVEADSITDAEVVVELHGLGECLYYRAPYSRDDAGRIVLGEPVAVREVTSYEPVAAPPLAMARAVLCESLPVHAPPVDGLTRGRPVQLLRLGPLYDAQTGDALLDVTDALCTDIAAAATALGFGVPIDMGHALYGGVDAAQLYGRLVEVEAREGSGLWGVPEWTGAGSALLAASPGLYYLSPTLLGPAKHPQTGEALPGRMLHSVSLTATPRQDLLDTLALSRGNPGGHVADPTTPRPAAATPDVVTLSRVDHVALLSRVTDAERHATELTAQLATKDAEALTLASRVEAIEAARAAETLSRAVDDEIRAAEAVGRVVPPTLRPVLLSATTEHRALVLGALPVTRVHAPAGSPGAGQLASADDPRVIRDAVALARSKGVPFSDAIQLARGGVS